MEGAVVSDLYTVRERERGPFVFVLLEEII